MTDEQRCLFDTLQQAIFSATGPELDSLARCLAAWLRHRELIDHLATINAAGCDLLDSAELEELHAILSTMLSRVAAKLHRTDAGAPIKREVTYEPSAN